MPMNCRTNSVTPNVCWIYRVCPERRRVIYGTIFKQVDHMLIECVRLDVTTYSGINNYKLKSISRRGGAPQIPLTMRLKWTLKLSITKSFVIPIREKWISQYLQLTEALEMHHWIHNHLTTFGIATNVFSFSRQTKVEGNLKGQTGPQSWEMQGETAPGAEVLPASK